MIPLEPDSLRLALDARLDESAQSWLADARVRVRSNPGAIATVFPAVGRHVGRQPLDPDPAAATVQAWSVDDAARTLLLVELGDGVPAQIEPLYRYGDTAERRGVIRALAFVEIDPSLGVKLVDDALRTNDVGLIAAAMGPFAVAHLDDAAYAQGCSSARSWACRWAASSAASSGPRRSSRRCSLATCSSVSPPAAMSQRMSGR